MRVRTWIMVAVLLTGAAAVAADMRTTTAQTVVTGGFASYKADGLEAAMRAWTEGGPLERNREAVARQNRYLREIEALYGPFKTFHVVQTVVISETCQVTYAQLDYATGPLFMKCMVFKGKDDWRIVNLRFHTEIEAIWPSALFAYGTDER